MRTLRLSLMGAFILVVLGGLASAVGAQDSAVDLSAPHSVTGTLSWGSTYEAGEMSEDRLSTEGQAWTARVRSNDDPRLGGSTRIVLNEQKFSISYKQLSGTIRIENQGGAWAGTLRGYRDPVAKPGSHYNIELTGEGGYAGHAAILQTVGSGDAHFEGFVFPAPLLDYPAPIEPFSR